MFIGINRVINIALLMSALVLVSCGGEDGGDNNNGKKQPVIIPNAEITIDGSADDWAGIEPIMIDPQGDQNGNSSTDLVSLRVAMDGENMTLLMEISGPVNMPHTPEQNYSHYDVGIHSFNDPDCGEPNGFIILVNFTSFDGKNFHRLETNLPRVANAGTSMSFNNNFIETGFFAGQLLEISKYFTFIPVISSFGHDSSRMEHDDFTPDHTCYSADSLNTGGGSTNSVLKVRDEETGLPIVGAKVSFISLDDEVINTDGTARVHTEYIRTTDENGNIDTTIFASNNYAINSEKSGYLPSFVQNGVWINVGAANNLRMPRLNMLASSTTLNPANKYFEIHNLLENTSSSIGNYDEMKPGLFAFDDSILTEEKTIDSWANNDNNGLLSRGGLILSGTLTSDDLRQFYKIRYDRMVEEIKQSNPGLTIWMDYNIGVILKEGDTVIAIDLSRSNLTILDDSLFNEVDAFFTTHEHKDHFDGYIAHTQNKPYYLPAIMLSGFESFEFPFHEAINIKNSTGISSGEEVIFNGWSINAYETPHNITNISYLITTPSGIKVLHTGDGQFGVAPPEVNNIDYLIAPSWFNVNTINFMISSFNVKSFIPAHFNELWHDNSLRFPYSTVENFSIATQDRMEVLFYGDSTNSLSLP